MKTGRSFSVLFALVMIVFVCFIVWYLPAAGNLRFQLQDTELSLETSRGRERKQQHEYDTVVKEIPEKQAELDRILPLSAAAEEEVKKLKEERKELRKRKKELESGENANAAEGGTSHE